MQDLIDRMNALEGQVQTLEGESTQISAEVEALRTELDSLSVVVDGNGEVLGKCASLLTLPPLCQPRVGVSLSLPETARSQRSDTPIGLPNPDSRSLPRSTDALIPRSASLGKGDLCFTGR